MDRSSIQKSRYLEKGGEREMYYCKLWYATSNNVCVLVEV